MPPLSPPIVFLICALLAGLSVFNLFTGNKRLREARRQGLIIAWYKQASILTGIEYLLIICVLLLNLGMREAWFPPALTEVVIALYLTALLLAALTLGTIIFWAIRGTRGAQRTQATTEERDSTQRITRTYTGANARKRRERRQKTTAARRRRTGRT